MYQGPDRLPPLTVMLRRRSFEEDKATKQLAIDKIAIPSHEAYLSDVALTMPPAALSSVAGVLVSRGEELVE